MQKIYETVMWIYVLQISRIVFIVLINLHGREGGLWVDWKTNHPSIWEKNPFVNSGGVQECDSSWLHQADHACQWPVSRAYHPCKGGRYLSHFCHQSGGAPSHNPLVGVLLVLVCEHSSFNNSIFLQQTQKNLLWRFLFFLVRSISVSQKHLQRRIMKIFPLDLLYPFVAFCLEYGGL